ncbi:MAG: hypothetical protein G01um101419_62 [Parcubacteria group bacterium Gr01-1014_19]|nr:MAG: hypothetical protein G01um101419_62 [Parcubacteria group bacterium Gr01-1014_19]
MKRDGYFHEHDPSGKWEVISYFDGGDGKIDLDSETEKFWKDFFAATEAMSERSEIRAFKVAYEKLGGRLGLVADQVSTLNILIKKKGSDCSINVASSGGIRAWQAAQSTPRLLTTHKGAATIERPAFLWDPLPEEPVGLVIAGSGLKNSPVSEKMAKILSNPHFLSSANRGVESRDFFQAFCLLPDSGLLENWSPLD